MLIIIMEWGETLVGTLEGKHNCPYLSSCRSFVAIVGIKLKRSEKSVSAVEKIRFEYEGQQKRN